MQFIYAVPKTNMIAEAKLKAFGLPDFIDSKATQTHTFAGPGGGDATLLIREGGKASQLYYKPDEQEWKLSLNGKFYVGYYNASPPSEPELRREVQMAGHEVELGDGAFWLVPVARVIVGGSRLPQSLMLGSKGEVIAEALPQYAAFSAKVEKVWQDFEGELGLKDGDEQLTMTERMQIAIESLGLNYAIGADEVNALGLLTTQNLSKVLAAVIDVPTVMKLMKKMELAKKKDSPAETADGSSINSGDSDS